MKNGALGMLGKISPAIKSWTCCVHECEVEAGPGASAVVRVHACARVHTCRHVSVFGECGGKPSFISGFSVPDEGFATCQSLKYQLTMLIVLWLDCLFLS
jgi:hypothetical protein